MIEAGDVHLADLNEEIRRRVLVVSVSRFHRLSDRAIVVPEVIGVGDEVSDPWRVTVGEAVFAVDLVRSIPAARLLDRVDRAPAPAMTEVRRALRSLT